MLELFCNFLTITLPGIAMAKHYVNVTPTFTIEEATRLMQEKQQSCVLVVYNEDFLEGITLDDLCCKRFVPSENSVSIQANSSTLDVCKLLILWLQFQFMLFTHYVSNTNIYLATSQANSSLVSSCLTGGFQFHGNERGLVTCFPEKDLSTAKVLMEVKGIKQLRRRNDVRRKVLGLLHYDSIGWCLR
jgi:CBS domain-containing protein